MGSFIIRTLHQILIIYLKIRWAGRVAWTRGVCTFIKFGWKKLKERYHLGQIDTEWDIIKPVLKKIGWEVVESIRLAGHMDEWLLLVKTL